MNIYQKISAIMQEVNYLSKDDHVKFGTTNYKAISEEKVTDLMHQQLVKQGLVVFPVEQTWERTNSITHVNVKYRIVNAEDPQDYIEVVSCGDGADTQDKGSGKAMTYAYKYMWLRTFAIPTGEDPDKICNEEIEKVQAAKAAAKKMEQAPEPQSVAAQLINETKAKALITRCQGLGVNVDKLLQQYGVAKAMDLNEAQHREISDKLTRVEEKRGKTA